MNYFEKLNVCASSSFSISEEFSAQKGGSSCSFHVIRTVAARLHTVDCTRQVVPLASSPPPSPRCCAFIFRTLAHRQTDHMPQSCSLRVRPPDRLACFHGEVIAARLQIAAARHLAAALAGGRFLQVGGHQQATLNPASSFTPGQTRHMKLYEKSVAVSVLYKLEMLKIFWLIKI